jgi:maltose alpha-D-glucosyltransferase/alpha-amylase
LAILERYVENQGDAWVYTLNYLERFLDDRRATPEPLPNVRHTAYMGLIKTLGLRTAEFHRALALPDEEGAFGSEPISASEINDWANKVRRGMEVMFELLAQELPQLPDAAQSVGSNLLAVRSKLYRRILRTTGMPMDAMKTRCHGDYFLGQVWLTNNDFLIANFGGEPGLTWTERRRKHTPLRDVASMLLSLSEVGAAALDHVLQVPAGAGTALLRDVEDWERLARRTFFRSYRKAMSGHPSCPAAAAAVDALVTLAMVEKATSSVSSALAQHSTAIESSMRQLMRVAQRGR